jgi:hypothetical protein
LAELDFDFINLSRVREPPFFEASADVTGMDVLDESSVELGLHFLLS